MLFGLCCWYDKQKCAAQIERPGGKGTAAMTEREQRVQWFQEARFGMFLHWGLYAIPGRGEWYMSGARMPAEEYERYMREFTAKAYDPRDWARRAKQAGMRYVVLTAKHHDGFCL